MTREEALKVLLNEWKCIDRNDGVNCDRKCESCDLVMDSFVLKDAYNTAIKALEQEPKTGHWIWCVGSHKCSNCEEYTWFSHKELLRYCPNCGARMEDKE